MTYGGNTAVSCGFLIPAVALASSDDLWRGPYRLIRRHGMAVALASSDDLWRV